MKHVVGLKEWKNERMKEWKNEWMKNERRKEWEWINH